MSTILDPKYLSMPEQVQKNKNDIEIINQYLQNVYKTSSTLTEDSTSINILNTNIDINNLNFSLLIDRQGHIYKIVDVIGEVVYLSFLTNIPGGTEYNFTGEWVSDNNEYYENDLVLYNGNLYLCELNVINSSTPPNEDIQHWSLFVGYGNDVSEFVNSEYNKSSNFLKLIDRTTTSNGITLNVKDGVITLNGTATASTTFSFGTADRADFSNIPINKNLVFKNFAPRNEAQLNISADGNTYFVQFTSSNSQVKTRTVTVGVTNLSVYIPSGTVLDNAEFKIMISEEETKSFFAWNGKIIHEIDIEPITLWKNKTPNVAFTAQSPNLTEEVRVGDVLEVCYKMNTTSGAKIEQVYVSELGKYCRLIDGSSNIRYREITPNGSTVYFSGGFLGENPNDEVMIPLWIKLRRY